MIRAALVALTLCAAPAAAQEIADAAAALRRAEAALAAADGEGRLAALGAAAAAQEDALAVLRAELRRIAQRRADLAPRAADLSQRAATAALAIRRIDAAPPVGWFLHPDGPLAARRAALVARSAAPALRRRAETLGADLATLDMLEAERRAAADLARAAIDALRATHAEIAAQTAARRAAPPDPETAQALDAARALLSRAAATLADGVTALPPRPEGAAPDIPFDALRGLMPPPVAGRIAAPYGTSGAQGMTLETAPYALVRAPATATLRYAGPIGRFAQVAILEPEAGALILLAGLARIDRTVGDVVLMGEPIGAMGGPPPASAEFLIDASRGNGTLSRESLYMELRRGGAPTDPAPWFAFAQERTSG
ncbi:MAG: murein hydrolase activator EnvC family protein [Rubrimonas sp.]|uniref:murein hydrolase activator EnvC family protein n=1 Tax=Rubrimonas sp. TaxID=2036015 RepID=UPI002FDCF0F6